MILQACLLHVRLFLRRVEDVRSDLEWGELLRSRLQEEGITNAGYTSTLADCMDRVVHATYRLLCV